jgi:hypothetical protein
MGGMGMGGSGGSSSGPWKFELNKHNFSFENYGGDVKVTNLTPAEMLRMFRDGVCASKVEGDSCELTPSANNWMESNNKGMNGGHCEGMATLSLLFATGKANPQDFGAATAFELKLEGNEKLQREIAYWWATQSVESVQTATLRVVPSKIVSTLQESLKGTGEAYTFGLYKRNQPKDGHANTPIAVVDEGDGKVKVKIYENNYPKDDKHFEIDTKAETWKYSASTNPNEPSALYDGDGGEQQARAHSADEPSGQAQVRHLRRSHARRQRHQRQSRQLSRDLIGQRGRSADRRRQEQQARLRQRQVRQHHPGCDGLQPDARAHLLG